MAESYLDVVSDLVEGLLVVDTWEGGTGCRRGILSTVLSVSEDSSIAAIPSLPSFLVDPPELLIAPMPLRPPVRELRKLFEVGIIDRFVPEHTFTTFLTKN